MKQPIDLARRFLTLADQDIKTFEVLIESEEIADSQIGFHAQQAVEKCLKAVLTLKEIEFRKTHDLDELLTSFETNNLLMLLLYVMTFSTQIFSIKNSRKK